MLILKPLKPGTGKWLPGKRMTLCLGMLASDGVVIAADSQESDQYFKRAQQKILTLTNIQGGPNPPPPGLACAITGAGRAGYLDAFFQFVFKDIHTVKNPQELETYVSEKLHEFHVLHIFPLALSTDCPAIDILIAAYVNWSTCMFVSSGSTLRRAIPHTAVGAGAHYALSIMSELSTIKDVRRTELLAAYIVATTKENIETCGKYTDIVSFHNPTQIQTSSGSQLVAPAQPLTRVPWATIQKWEQSFAARWALKQMALIDELLEEELTEDSTPSVAQMSEDQQ